MAACVTREAEKSLPQYTAHHFQMDYRGSLTGAG